VPAYCRPRDGGPDVPNSEPASPSANCRLGHVLNSFDHVAARIRPPQRDGDERLAAVDGPNHVKKSFWFGREQPRSASSGLNALA